MDATQPKPRSIRRSPTPARKKHTPVQPLEPMLLPKLRIYFADFPWSHCSIDQRLFTSESGCGYRYGQSMREEIDLWRGFLKNSQGTERCESTPLSLCVQARFLQLKWESRRQRRQREKRTLHRLDYSGPAVVNCFKASKFPTNRFRNVGRIPFLPLPTHYHEGSMKGLSKEDFLWD